MTEKIIEKISRYNVFNYLFPGALFMILAPKFLGKNLSLFFNQNLIASLFLAYFIGMVISRIGSVVIEFILKKIKFIEFAEYKDFLEASKIDKKINTLSEENNIYRTLISLFLSLLFVYGFVFLLKFFNINMEALYVVIFVFCLILFLFSYRKQTNYIKRRILKTLNKKLDLTN